MNDHAADPAARTATILVTFEPPTIGRRPAYVACVRVAGRPTLTVYARKRAVVEQLARTWCATLGLRVSELRPGAQSSTPAWLEAASDRDRVRFHRQLARLATAAVRTARAA